MNKGRVLTIAGSDSGGGAGIQADIKTVTALGGYASSAITALTAQNTMGVYNIHEVPADFVAEQVDLVLSDIGADVIKTGMLYSYQIIEAIDYVLQNYTDIPLVIDPVMVSKNGRILLKEDAVDIFMETLLKGAFLLTPNVPEAELLADMKIKTVDQMKAAGEIIRKLGAKNVLVKGGHLEKGVDIHDVLVSKGGAEVFSSERLDASHTHGTGCTLASAIAVNIAKGVPIRESVINAREYVFNAIKHAPRLGKGNGPLAHGWKIV